MPKGKTKKFIDKKNSVTFHLVHRSQKDPLVADETAPQRVLVPVTGQAPKSERKPQDEKNKRKEEEHKYGIYFDDDYDYLQHLRDVRTLTAEWERLEPAKERSEKKDAQKINLPSSVFESNVEEKVGLLNKAAPTGLQLDLDPDIVAAMDDDFDFEDPENQLEDNFIELANVENAEGKEYEFDSDEMTDDEDVDEDEDEDELASLNGAQYTFRDEETKSRFTEYSMSSSVMRRNEQLTLLDDKFERMYAAYDESEIGALDCDEIEGHVPADADILLQCAAEFEQQQRQDQQRYTDVAENVAQLMRERMKIIEQECPSSDSDERELEKLVVDAREREKWDCESIISTYSNIYNHPKLIAEPKGPGKIKVDPRTGIPRNVLLNSNAGKLTVKSLAEFDQQNENFRLKGEPRSSRSIAETMRSTLSTLSIRPKGETAEERKERKKALKEYRKERRLERKANTEAFKEEKKRQEKIMLNNRQNVQGNRIL